MNRFYKGYDDIEASDVFKQRMVRTLQSEARTEEPVRIASGLRMKRRTFIAVIAAAALAIGTAVAVGVSTVGRMKENNEARIEMPEDERYREAREYAIQRISDIAWEKPVTLNETAAVGDLKIVLQKATYDDHELELVMKASSEKTALLLTLDAAYLQSDLPSQEIARTHDSFCLFGTDACNFRLTIDGRDYAAYAWDDPPIAAGNGDGDTYVMSFRELPEIENGTAMTLSGTLYYSDRQGNCTGQIGSFSIPFVYEFTDEMREAEIDRMAREIMTYWERRDQNEQQTLSELPEEASRIDQTAGITTFLDVTSDDEGLLLGLVNHYQAASATRRYFVMNGYYLADDLVSSVQSNGSKDETQLVRLPYYADIDFVPDTVTVACVTDVAEMNLSGDWYEKTSYEETTFVFRYNRRTGEVTLPKDEAEKAEWYQPIMPVYDSVSLDPMEDYYDMCSVEGVSMEQNGVTVSIEKLGFTRYGTMLICYRAEPLACEEIIEEHFPAKICINGVQKTRKCWNGNTELPHRTDEQIRDFMDSHKWKKSRWHCGIWETDSPMRLDMYDGPITVEVKDWELYDLNEQGERTYVGTYSFTFTVDPANFREMNRHDLHYIG